MMSGEAAKPDTSAIKQHLSAITARWGELTEPAEIEIRALNREIGNPHIGRFKPGDLDGAADWCAALNSSRNIYVVVNPVRATAPRACSDGDIIAAIFNWIDCDTPEAVTRQAEFVGPKHTATVLTGKAPFTRVHRYWELWEWQHDLDAWRDLQVRLAAFFGSDRAVINPSRIMRVAGTITHPDEGKRAKGYTSEMAAYAPRPGASPIQFSILSDLFPPASAAPQSAPERPTGGLQIDTGAQASLDRDAAYQACLRGEEWHNNMVRFVASCVSRGLKDWEVHALTDGLTLTGYTVDQTRDEVQQAIDGARRKGWDQSAYAQPEAAQIPDFTTPQPETEKPKSELEWFDDITPSLGDDYIIKGVMGRGSMSVVYGPSNSGKTFFALDMAYHVAIGADWRGHRVKGGGVLYLAAEGGRGLINRVAALRAETGVCDVPLAVRRGGLDLLHATADLEAIGKMAWEVHQRQPIALIVIDTLSRVIAGGDENSAQDMTAFIRNVDKLREAIGCHIMIVHHTGKDAARGARGHSSLRAATDTEIEVANEDGARAAMVTKQRDYHGGETFAFSLKPVTLGTDSDGDDVSSCVVTAEDSDEFTAQRKRTKGLGGNQRVLADVFENMLSEGMARPNPGGFHMPEPGQFWVVDYSQFRELAMAKLVSENPRQAFNQAIKALCEDRGLFCKAEEMVWRTDRRVKS